MRPLLPAGSNDTIDTRPAGHKWQAVYISLENDTAA